LNPVVLTTPRWSEGQRFLDDIATDLSIGTPSFIARTLSLAPLQGRHTHECWRWLSRALSDFFDLADVGGPLISAVDRHGFRHVLGGLFRRTNRGPRRALLVHGLEHVNVEVTRDLFQAYVDHQEEVGATRRLVMLFGGAAELPPPGVPSEPFQSVLLPDYTPIEAVEALAEQLGPTSAEELSRLCAWIGGVPALIEQAGQAARQQMNFVRDIDDVCRLLGPLADEVRGAVSTATSSDEMHARFEQIVAGDAGSEVLPTDAGARRVAFDARRSHPFHLPASAALC
jgi:hypothetical protein